MRIFNDFIDGIAQYDKNVICTIDNFGTGDAAAFIDLDNGNIKKKIVVTGYAPLKFAIPDEMLISGQNIKAYVSSKNGELLGIITIQVTKRPNPDLFEFYGEPILQNISTGFNQGSDILKTKYKGNFKDKIEIMTRMPVNAKSYIFVTKDEKYNQFADLVPERIYLVTTTFGEDTEAIETTFQVLGESGEDNTPYDNNGNGGNCSVKYTFKELLRSSKTNTTWDQLETKPTYPTSWVVLQPGVKIAEYLKTFKGA